MVALDDRRTFRQAFGAVLSGKHVAPELRLVGRDEPWAVVMRAVPRVSPRSVAVSISGTGGMPPPPPPPPPPPEPRDRLEHFALRFPFAVVALRPDLRVAFTNSRARQLLGREAVKTGDPFGEGAPAELRALAHRLVTMPAPLHLTTIDLADGRRLQVSGLARTESEPAFLFLEDATEQHRRDRVMREFLRNAAHQLRTPLAGIAAAIETLQSGAKNDPATRDLFLEHLQTHADRLTRIARGLLLLARTEDGETVVVDFVELAPLVDEVVATVEPLEAVTLVADCRPGLAALGSPDLLHEAVAALVENAVRHTREGEIRVTAADRDGEVAITVADSGPGILPEFQDRVFEPFFRAPAAGEGFGLGLAIAAQAVHAMHGKIDVSSAPGAGTVFTVTLPSATVVS
jgi:signal transduction histidine kinase